MDELQAGQTADRRADSPDDLGVQLLLIAIITACATGEEHRTGPPSLARER